MPRAAAPSLRMTGPGPEGTRSFAQAIGGFASIPFMACLYATVIFPLIIVSCDPTDSVCLLEPRPESKIFWPILAAVALVLALRNFSRLNFPPHILWLFGYLALAGASVLWAFNPQASFVRFLQQTMIVVSIVIPALLASRKADLMRGLFLCFAIATVLNAFFVLGRPPIDTKFATWGYPGYFSGKNYLGECEAIAVLLAFHEALHPGRRRVFGILIAIAAFVLLILSNSKTALGLMFLTPMLAVATLLLRKMTRISLALILLAIPIGWLIFTTLTGFSVYRISNILYGDPTFTGRATIWEFVESEISHRPLLGWGYQSFWLAGPDAPSIVNAPGWVKDMPNGHNGYLDIKVELGYVGYVLFLGFILTSLHAIGRIAERAPVRAWIILTLALQVIITNGLESIWMRGFEMLWIVFLILAAEIARYRLPVAARAVRRRPKPRLGAPKPALADPSHRARSDAIARAQWRAAQGATFAATHSPLETAESPATVNNRLILDRFTQHPGRHNPAR
ncbi:MAG: O-antigen ligase family protein [Xanthobacteraceae bacterium]|nr:O-antigen ligase family protein [Xanthobacteraceae bacterium]